MADRSNGHMGRDQQVISDHYTAMTPNMEKARNLHEVARRDFVPDQQHDGAMTLESIPRSGKPPKSDSKQHVAGYCP